MKLLIDVGNSKTKIGIWNHKRLSNLSVYETKDFFKNISKYKKNVIDEIYVTSVISQKDNTKIKSYLEKIFKINYNQICSLLIYIYLNDILNNILNNYIKIKIFFFL